MCYADWTYFLSVLSKSKATTLDCFSCQEKLIEVRGPICYRFGKVWLIIIIIIIILIMSNDKAKTIAFGIWTVWCLNLAWYANNHIKFKLENIPITYFQDFYGQAIYNGTLLLFYTLGGFTSQCNFSGKTHLKTLNCVRCINECAQKRFLWHYIF